jgi:ribosome recycling factor
MSQAQENRREVHIKRAEAELDSELAPLREIQTKLREDLAKHPAQAEVLQQELDEITEKIGLITKGSHWYRLYMKD